MRVIIAGSRGITDPACVADAIVLSGFTVSTVVCGGARGVDQLGSSWARGNGIPIVHYRPDWERYGKRAGILRNVTMAENADALIAVWDGVSRGTQNMIAEAKTRKLKVHIYLVKRKM